MPVRGEMPARVALPPYRFASTAVHGVAGPKVTCVVRCTYAPTVAVRVFVSAVLDMIFPVTTPLASVIPAGGEGRN